MEVIQIGWEFNTTLHPKDDLLGYTQAENLEELKEYIKKDYNHNYPVTEITFAEAEWEELPAVVSCSATGLPIFESEAACFMVTGSPWDDEKPLYFCTDDMEVDWVDGDFFHCVLCEKAIWQQNPEDTRFCNYRQLSADEVEEPVISFKEHRVESMSDYHVCVRCYEDKVIAGVADPRMFGDVREEGILVPAGEYIDQLGSKFELTEKKFKPRKICPNYLFLIDHEMESADWEDYGKHFLVRDSAESLNKVCLELIVEGNYVAVNCVSHGMIEAFFSIWVKKRKV